MDAYQSRLPTNVSDVARLLLQIAHKFPLSTPAPSILHFSSHTPYNKYQMCEVIARALGGALIDHIKEDKNKPTDGVVRPEVRLPPPPSSSSLRLRTDTLERWSL